MHSVVYNPAEGLLTATVEGIMAPEEATLYVEAMCAGMEAAARHPRGRVLIDNSHAAVQQAASYAIISSLHERVKARLPTAVVVASSLARLQAGRGVQDPSTRLFMSLAEARTWLEGARAAA